MDSRVTLDFDGKVFKVPKDILSKAGYFRNLLTDCSIEDIIYVPLSGMIFEHILALLRNPNYNFPPEYYSELDIYQIDLLSDMIVLDLQGTRFVIRREKLASFSTLKTQIEGKRYIYIDRSAVIFNRLLNSRVIIPEDDEDAVYYGLTEDVDYMCRARGEWVIFDKKLCNKSTYLADIVGNNTKIIPVNPKVFNCLINYLSDDSYKLLVKYVDFFRTTFKINVPVDRIRLESYVQCNNTTCKCTNFVKVVDGQRGQCYCGICFKTGCDNKKDHCNVYCDQHRCKYLGWSGCDKLAIKTGFCKYHNK